MIRSGGAGRASGGVNREPEATPVDGDSAVRTIGSMKKTLIRIRKLTKHYPMGDTLVRALDGLDFDIRAGEFLSITGPSGSGKSTIMHILGCLDRPTAGEYWLDGELVSAMSDRQLAIVRNTKIGFVFQTFNLIQRTSALDNVAIPLFYARKTRVAGPARRALERVGLGARASHKPSELSGGERQRVAIARSIVNEPKIIFADEPTGNLDTRTGRQIMEIFHELNRSGVTIILVTHEKEVALQAERIIRMRDGRIVEDRPVHASERLTPVVPLDTEEPDDEPREKASKSPPPMARPARAV